ncbi:MAG: hypothetical protein EZS28_005053 [Streblomastix strix]|uniref:RRM domain-containing protein n=1 Tax=Streblomastix strix TaxID=222440 RepID=A0A5J4WWK7_9EUKA|nr:MAG: hypothetical protein EZS28_005053 [Streblomastix strix]
MQLFVDEEIWSILAQRGQLEKIILKFDPQTETYKGFAFAVYSSDKEVEQFLSQGQVIDLGDYHLWLEKGQKNSGLVVYCIDSKITINKMAEDACQYGKVMILETALIKGGKTLFIEYNRRVDAELIKSCFQEGLKEKGMNECMFFGQIGRYQSTALM